MKYFEIAPFLSISGTYKIKGNLPRANETQGAFLWDDPDQDQESISDPRSLGSW